MGRRLLVFTDWWRINPNYIKYLRAILPFLCKIQVKNSTQNIVQQKQINKIKPMGPTR
jgi:hypothetical protein